MKTSLDFGELVTLVSYGSRLEDIPLSEAVRLVVEEFPEKTAKQLSSFIERKSAPPIGPLSAIRALYDRPDFPR